MHRRSDRGRLAVDLCLVFDLGDHADSGPTCCANIKGERPTQGGPRNNRDCDCYVIRPAHQVAPRECRKGRLCRSIQSRLHANDMRPYQQAAGRFLSVTVAGQPHDCRRATRRSKCW